MPEDDKNRSASTSANGAPNERAATAAPANRRWLRIVLLVLGPVLVLVGGAYVYMNTGRYAETDNAYVKTDTVLISAEVAGLIERVVVRENELVRAGDVLFEIDDRPYQVQVERGESQLEAVQSFVEGLEASYRQRLEELELAHINVAFAKRELERQQGLAARKLGSDADVDRAQHEFDVATQQIPIIENALAQLRAQLGGQVVPGVDGKPVYESNAAYRTVKSMLDDAVLDLEHTTVRAPFGGIATRVPVAGRYVAVGSPVMSFVSGDRIWVEANYKETELTHVAPGQAATVRIDTYPDREWHGRVESISPATGSEFSVIPAQNASGNWVKVAQRIPVRIALDIAPGDPPLRAGMSAIVEIDTGFEREAPHILSLN
jgi:membrane fusion protein (multidrug efflux system)